MEHMTETQRTHCPECGEECYEHATSGCECVPGCDGGNPATGRLMSTRKLTTPRIGPRMLAALAVIADNPGCTKHYVSLAVGPNGSNAYGYRIVQRTIAAGLVKADLGPRGYALYLSDAGLAAHLAARQ